MALPFAFFRSRTDQIRMHTNLRIPILIAAMAAADIVLAQSPAYPPPTWETAPGEYDAPEIPPHAEQWRYSFRNGNWWYFSPERRWLYWSQGRWVDYLPPGRSNTPPYVQPPVAQRQARWRRFVPRGAPFRSTPPGGWSGGFGLY